MKKENPSNQIKFGVFTDLHTDIIHDPEKRITAFLHACEANDVDFMIQLGDFIAPPIPGSTVCAEEDVTDTMRNNLSGKGISDERKKALLAMFDRLNVPFYHVLGNHDLDLYTKEENMNFWGMPAPYYSFDVKNRHFVVLDMNYGWEGEEELSFHHGNYQKWMFKPYMPFPIMPKAELAWLEEDLNQTDKPTIIFSHEGLNEGFLNAVNHEEIFQILKNAPHGVELCISGHKHQDLIEEEAGIPVYFLNSMSGYSVPSCFGATRFDEATEAAYPNVRNMCVYEDPLFAMVTVENKKITIEGRNSQFISPQPEEIGVHFDDPSVVLTSHASSLVLKTNKIDDEKMAISSFFFENMDELVCMLDMDYNIIKMNAAYLDFFGKQGMSITEGINLNDIPFNTDQNKNLHQFILDNINKRQAMKDYLFDVIGWNGETYKFKVNLEFATYEGQEIAIAIMTNLTLLMNSYLSLVRYTSKNIAEYITTDADGKALGGVSKDMTIVMSDLRGFTAISKDMSATDLVEMTNHYFAEMVTPVNQYGGNILEFLGDGIFIVFGAPNNDPNHAANAVACAIEMQNAMENVNQWNRENGFPELEMGIGINSGIAVAGNIGSEAQMRYGCLGENVNLAGRIEGYSIGHQILISQQTKDKIQEKLIFKGEQEILPKGAKEPMMIYDVTGIEGDYHLSCAEDMEEIIDLKEKIALQFSFITDKVVGEEVYSGCLTAISERFGILDTDAPVKKGDNIMFELKGSVYAKIMDEEERGRVICFTSKPDHFDEAIQPYR